MKLDYDNTNPKSIESYGQKMIGKSFREILDDTIFSEEEESSYGNKKRKGGLGNLIEERFFGYKANSDRSADFAKAGVEVKATPYKKVLKKGKGKGKTIESYRYSAGERLVLTMIENNVPVVDDFYKSHLWKKCKLLLLIFYFRNKSLPSNLDYIIDFVKLFTPPENDLRIIIEDYNTIINKIKKGLAHELSEGDTKYLGACTKGANAEKSLSTQYYSNIPAKRRAFSFKTSYMTYILNNYIINDNIKKHDSESIIDITEETYSNRSDIIRAFKEERIDFDTYVIKLIDHYVGYTADELVKMLDSNEEINKAFFNNIVYRILGIKSNRATEFVKANISIRAIRLEEDGKIVESSPLPPVEFMEIYKEDWDNSGLKDYLDSKRFLFVVFKKVNGIYTLKGAKFWNMPVKDIDIAREFWEKIKSMITNDEVEFTPKMEANRIIIKNNLPKKAYNPIIHMRPHTKLSYYVMKDGTTYGSGKLSNTSLLPNGVRMTKQSFWLNNNYVMEIIKDLINN